MVVFVAVLEPPSLSVPFLRDATDYKDATRDRVGGRVRKKVALLLVFPELLARERRRLAVRRVLRTRMRKVDMVAPHLLPKRLQHVVRTFESMGRRSHRIAQKASTVWRHLLRTQAARRRLAPSSHGTSQEEARESTKRQSTKDLSQKFYGSGHACPLTCPMFE